ncbi:hypothetical protein D3C76_1033360 [compost metagenome]
MIEGREQVIGGQAAGVAADHLPVGRIAPALVDGFQRFLIGSRLALQRQGAAGLGHQAAVAGQLHVQALGKIADGLVLARGGQVFGQRLVGGFRRQGLAVPVGNGLDGQRHRADHFGVVHALVEERDDRHQEDQHQENQQGQDQRLRLQTVHPFGARQALLEGGAGDLVQRHGGGHSELR